MNKALFGVFLIGIVAAQTPPDQARQIELQKEAMRKAEVQRIHEAIDQERERLRQRQRDPRQSLWVADVDSGGAGHHPPAAAQENGE